MHYTRLACIIVLALFSFGIPPARAELPPKASGATALAAADEAIRVRQHNEMVWFLVALEHAQLEEKAAQASEPSDVIGVYQPSVTTTVGSVEEFLACTRAHESDSAGGYAAVSSGGTYRGAYQFDSSTWNSTAESAGRPDLIGADPATVAPADQDALARLLYAQRGNQPWGGRC